MKVILQTPRLLLREFRVGDEKFIITLVNTPGWLEFIGDRNIKTVEDANNYLMSGPMTSYVRFGFGLYLVQLTETQEAIGMCGLIKRDHFDDVDIGFAFLPDMSGKGYAYEAASATLDYAKQTLGIGRIIAITNSNNVRSIKLLNKLGLGYEKKVKMPEEKEELLLFANEPEIINHIKS
jgi:RimJ/RimL family protein N-acetyltransferase